MYTGGFGDHGVGWGGVIPVSVVVAGPTNENPFCSRHLGQIGSERSYRPQGNAAAIGAQGNAKA